MPRLKRKRFIVLALIFAGLAWVLWPIYGFLSNQYETARLPWGWTDLPAEAPIGTSHVKPAYVVAGETATGILETRRAKIGAPSLSAAVSVNESLSGRMLSAGKMWRNINLPAIRQFTELDLRRFKGRAVLADDYP